MSTMGGAASDEDSGKAYIDRITVINDADRNGAGLDDRVARW